MVRTLVFLAAAAATFAADLPKVVNDGYGDYMLVPAGPFKMGDNFGDGELREGPVHTVDLDAYYVGKYEITNGEWRKFRDDPGYDDPKFWPSGRVVPKTQVPYWTQANNHGGGTPDSDNYPVLGVNWDSAVAYCNWLSAKTGKKYRLPTEAEWEKAARGRTNENTRGATRSTSRTPISWDRSATTPDKLSAITTGASAETCRHATEHLRTACMTWPAT